MDNSYWQASFFLQPSLDGRWSISMVSTANQHETEDVVNVVVCFSIVVHI